MTSASAASALAAAVPVTPMAPRLSGWLAGSADLPAWVSPTGMPWRSQNSRSAAAASEYSTPPPQIISGWRAARTTGAARVSSSRAGGVRRGLQTRSANRLAGQSQASACTSWHSASVTGPQPAGSVRTCMARWKARHQLLGPRDAVEVARQRPQAVVGRDEPVAEVLELLQHRVGPARGEHIAGQQQHRQAVDVRHRRGGGEVGRARPDRGRARHHAAPVRGLGIGDRRVAHRLLVVGAQRRQLRARLVQRLRRARRRCRARRSPTRRRTRGGARPRPRSTAPPSRAPAPVPPSAGQPSTRTPFGPWGPGLAGGGPFGREGPELRGDVRDRRCVGHLA